MNNAQQADRNGQQSTGAPALNSHEITERLNTSWLGRPCIVFDEVASTMDVARAMSEEGLRPGAVVVADRQHSGRGSRGRTWHSSEPLGLWCSALLPDSVDPGVVPHIVAAGVRAALEKIGVASALKWPNDVLAPFSSKNTLSAGLPITWPFTRMLGLGKIAGVLVEKPSGSGPFIAGIGVNVNHLKQDFPSHVQDTATSVRLATGMTHDRAELLTSILGETEQRYDTARRGRKQAIEELADEWRRHSTVLGRRIAVTLADGTSFVGEAQEITVDGSLLVDTGGGREAVHSGTVRLLVGGEDVR